MDEPARSSAAGQPDLGVDRLSRDGQTIGGALKGRKSWAWTLRQGKSKGKAPWVGAKAGNPVTGTHSYP